MRLSTSTAALLVSTAGFAAASDRAECFKTRSRELASSSSCGDWGSINYCLSQTSPLANAAVSGDLALITVELESCFLNAGCSRDESQVEAFWTLRRCEEAPADLRRRFVGLAAAPLTAAVAKRLPEIATATSAGLWARDTTVASPSPCTTDTTVETRTCPTQSTGTDSGKQLSCFQTQVTTAVCVDGLVCQSKSLGQVTCMYAQNKLDTGGIVVAIIMATAVALSTVGVCFCCCRERSTQRRLAKAAEAAAIAREAKNSAMVANKRPAAGARIPTNDLAAGQPLMPESGADSHGGPNPFADTHPALR
ncbi:hypothetical protein GQ53DRAFT_747837 [Thozetella sp. PMI_491]|nr:hypothetical protein GQ53DRAFT_747837 [Thozetella sp. PMI_491]